MAKLYEIVAELQEFAAQMEGMEDEQAYRDTLEGLQGELDDKVSQWARCIKNLEGERDAIKAEGDRLTKRARSIDNEVKHMKETLLMYLKAAGVSKAGDTVIKASIVKNGGQAPLEIDLIPIDLPEDFQRITIDADKEAIRAALESGQVLEWARLAERGEHIKIG